MHCNFGVETWVKTLPGADQIEGLEIEDNCEAGVFVEDMADGRSVCKTI